MFSSFIYYAEGAVVFLIMLSVLVAAHELGHYLFARLFNMGVEEFAVGMFGKKPLLTYMRRRYRLKIRPGEDPYVRQQPSGGFNFEGGGDQKEAVVLDSPSGRYIEETTDFTIRPWPIGGFVRIKGMMPQEDGSEVRVPGGFYSKSPVQRLVVLFAGPLFSVLAGIIVLVPLYMFGGVQKPQDVPVLGMMVKDEPAYKADLRPLDTVVSINGRPIKTFYQMVQIVRESSGIPLLFVYDRKGARGQTIVTPKLSKDPYPVLGPDLQFTGELKSQGMIGISPLHKVVNLGFAEAVASAVSRPWMAVRGLVELVQQPSTAKEAVGGPVAMFNDTSSAVQQGFTSIMELAALISISVGIFNLLPIYPLDGGQMVVAFAELLRGGRRLTMQFQNTVATLGLGMVLLIVVGVLFVDISRFTGKQTPPPKIIDVPTTAPSPAKAK